MAIELDQDDVTRAETLLTTIMEENIPEGRFTEGSALRDLAIKAIAFAFAHLQKDNETVRSLQSLLNVQNIAVTDPDTDTSVANATDALLSNWFITRNGGAFSRGRLIINVSRRQDYVVPGNQRFSYDRARAFFPDVKDTSQNLIIAANSLIPLTSTDGTIEAYQFTISVVASRSGDDYNVDPSVWEAGGSFSPFVTSVFNSVRFENGKSKETTSEIITRSETAIAVRNLINDRSISATLTDEFSTIERQFVIGMGDPEMQRDLASDAGGSGIVIHVGGHYDVYLELPRVETTFEGQVGGTFIRPDNLINIFKDTTITDWTTESIQLGDVLRVGAGLDESPRDFIIREILSSELRVSTRTPFSEATDEAGTFVDYFIYRPKFGTDLQVLPLLSVNTQGQTSRSIQTPNRLVLPGGAHYDIVDVAVLDPDPGDPNISTADGLVHFPVRSNEAPNPVISQEFLEYQVVNASPATAQSQISFEELLVESTYNNKTVRVTYETLPSLEVIHDFTTSRFERILAGSILARGFLPIYVNMAIPYRLKKTATALVDEEALVKHTVDFINTFSPTDVLDVSDISTTARTFDSNIGAVLPFDISYTLIVPDGRTIMYITSDEVKLDSDNIADDLANSDLNDPLSLGVSDNTVRYMTTTSRVSVVEQT